MEKGGGACNSSTSGNWPPGVNSLELPSALLKLKDRTETNAFRSFDFASSSTTRTRRLTHRLLEEQVALQKSWESVLSTCVLALPQDFKAYFLSDAVHDL